MRPNGAMTRLMVTFAVALGIPILVLTVPGYSQNVKALKKEDEEMRRTMLVMSRQLNVDCTKCHNPKNFASAEKNEFRVAKEHMRLTQLLIDNGFDGREKRPKADCYMCHRGQLKPDYREKMDPLSTVKEKPKVNAPADESNESE